MYGSYQRHLMELSAARIRMQHQYAAQGILLLLGDKATQEQRMILCNVNVTVREHAPGTYIVQCGPDRMIVRI